MTKNLLITLLSVGGAALVTTGALTIPPAIGRSNYQKGQAAEAEGNLEQALEYYQSAAKRHNVDALFMLGEIYAGDTATWAQAVACYEEAHQGGKVEATVPLAKAYLFGQGVEEDAKKGFAYAKEAADNEDVQSCMLVGYCYESGIGTVRDEQKAFDYYQHSATQDNPTGLYYLARCYLNGTGVTRDTQKGQDLMNESAQLGCKNAQDFLEEQERERKRKAQEEKRAREYARSHTYMECTKCHGRGTTYDQFNNKVICTMCWGKGVVSQEDIEKYRNSIFSLPSW